MTEDSENPQPFGAKELEKRLNRRLNGARKLIKQNLNRLWAGNGAGVITTANLVDNGEHWNLIFLLPSVCFFIGMIVLGFGSFTTLRAEARLIRDMEKATSLLDLKMDHIRRPSEEAGLTLSNQQTQIGLAAAIAFVLGVALCLILLLRQTYR